MYLSDKLKKNLALKKNVLMRKICMGSSTETVAFQVYEILKINHEFLQFF